jgi:hypothetical protein
MSNGVIAFLIGLGFAGWMYSKIYRSTGGNTRNALITAGVAGLAVFVIIFIIFNMVLPK